jgi:hypothetical protein
VHVEVRSICDRPSMIDGADSASIAGSAVTVNVPVQPKGYVYHVIMDLLFG